MDAAAALADLIEISTNVEGAVVCDGDGVVEASTFAVEGGGRRLARTAKDLLEAAAELPSGRERQLSQLEVALSEGSVFVVRGKERLVAATTAAGAPAGLVLYDLRSCLRAIDDADETPSPAGA